MATVDNKRFLHPEAIKRISRLDLRARHIVEGYLSGLHHSPYFGQSVEFLIVPRQVIVGLVSRDGSFARAMSSMCAQRLRSVTARLSAQISRSTLSRLASALMPYSVPGPGLIPACAPLLSMNQAQFAIAADRSGHSVLTPD